MDAPRRFSHAAFKRLVGTRFPGRGGLTRVAELMGVDVSSPSRWASHQVPNGTEIGRIAEILRVSADDLYEGGEMSPHLATVQAALRAMDDTAAAELARIADGLARMRPAGASSLAPTPLADGAAGPSGSDADASAPTQAKKKKRPSRRLPRS